MDNQKIAWGNENPSAPKDYDEHIDNCPCISCCMKREDGDIE